MCFLLTLCINPERYLKYKQNPRPSRYAQVYKRILSEFARFLLLVETQGSSVCCLSFKQKVFIIKQQNFIPK